MKHYTDVGTLVAIECDACGALIAPGRELADSGWWNYSQIEGSTIFEWNYCDKHEDIKKRADVLIARKHR